MHVVEEEEAVVETLKVVEAGEDVATAGAVKLEEAMAGLEIIAAGKAEVRPMMAKATVVVDRCMLGKSGVGKTVAGRGFGRKGLVRSVKTAVDGR